MIGKLIEMFGKSDTTIKPIRMSRCILSWSNVEMLILPSATMQASEGKRDEKLGDQKGSPPAHYTDI